MHSPLLQLATLNIKIAILERDIMNESKAHLKSTSKWGSLLFIIAGIFMLINTAFLWIHYYSGFELSLVWAAIPAIIALTSSILGLLKLYPQARKNAPLIAKTGAIFALLASASISIAALWILYVSMLGEGMPEQRPQWFLAIIAIFMIAMILAFLSNAVAFWLDRFLRKIGILLAVPLLMWAIMLVVGALKGMEAGLSLDYYTNAVIAGAFLALGFLIKKNNTNG